MENVELEGGKEEEKERAGRTGYLKNLAFNNSSSNIGAVVRV